MLFVAVSSVSSRLPTCVRVQSDRDTRLFSSCLGLAQGSRFPPSVSWGQVHYSIINPPCMIHHAAVTHRSVTVRKWKPNRSHCSQSQMVSHSCCLTVEGVIIYSPTPSLAYKYGWNIHQHTHIISPRVQCGAEVVCEKCESDVLHGVSLQLSTGVGPCGSYHTLHHCCV